MTDSPADLAGHHGALPRLSRLGLGAWAFGRTGWGVQSDDDSRAAILRAVELGVNWIDTAAVYGDGHSERLIGQTLRKLDESERPLVFTKGGLLVDPFTGTTVRDLRPASLRRQCDASLRRLQVDRIDLYQLHWPVADPRELEAAWETLGELQREGKISWAGVSNFDVSMIERCSAIRAVDTVQMPLSLLHRQATSDLLPCAATHGVRSLAYSPLESGLLSGRFSTERVSGLPETDWRRNREQFQPPYLDRALALVARLEPLAREVGVTLAQMAIAWAGLWPGVSGVIVGARNAHQVDSWIEASSLDFDDALLNAIAGALRDTQAGTGPLNPRSSHTSASR